MFLTNRLRSITTIFWCAAAPALCSTAAVLSGVLYSDHGGPSGAGTGDIRLASGKKVYKLFYQKPFPKDFSSVVCGDPGAIWSVVATIKDAETGTLVSASCTGQVDEQANEAWLVVRSFIKHLEKPLSADSFDHLSARLRHPPGSISLLKKLQDISFASYERFGGGARCLDIADVPSPEEAHIQAGIGCYLWKQERSIKMFFRVVRNPQSKRWEIDNVDVR